MASMDVYDLTVPTYHNFVANDFIVHNSIEQDADVVIFVYREDYYNEDTDRQNIADLMIAKHRPRHHRHGQPLFPQGTYPVPRPGTAQGRVGVVAVR